MRILSLLALVLTLSACDSSDPAPGSNVWGDAVAPDSTSCIDGLTSVEDLPVGTGQAAALSSRISIRYTGRLTDGTVFDSATLPRAVDPRPPLVSSFVPGFQQGIAGRAATDDAPALAPMRLGGRRMIRIPPNLAYGFNGIANGDGTFIIPRCSTLEFEVDLLDLG